MGTIVSVIVLAKALFQAFSSAEIGLLRAHNCFATQVASNDSWRGTVETFASVGADHVVHVYVLFLS
jgi:hypothetical protein